MVARAWSYRWHPDQAVWGAGGQGAGGWLARLAGSQESRHVPGFLSAAGQRRLFPLWEKLGSAGSLSG